MENLNERERIGKRIAELRKTKGVVPSEVD